MNADESAALHWLLGRENAPGPGEPPSRGRAALIRLLRTQSPLNPDLRNALANLLEPIGGSRMKLVLDLQYRKAGKPSNRVAVARRQMEDGAAIDAAVQRGEKPYVAIEAFSEKNHKSKAAASVAYKAYLFAKSIREGS
jgi:uncharacterized protein (DUF58 family)